MSEEKNVGVKQATPADLLNIAIDGKADLDKLERLMILQEKWEANQAKKAYSEAMTAFKASPPKIEKDKKVKYTTKTGINVNYNHATLWNITEKISAELSKHGLSAAWITKQEGANVTVTCKISHIKGHSEETSLTAGLDDSGGKNTIQALGSAISYLERYTLLALAGLATHDMDTDGKVNEEVKYVSDKQKSTIVDMINAKEVDEDKFLEYMGIESVSKLPERDYNKAMMALRSAKGKAKK